MKPVVYFLCNAGPDMVANHTNQMITSPCGDKMSSSIHKCAVHSVTSTCIPMHDLHEGGVRHTATTACGQDDEEEEDADKDENVDVDEGVGGDVNRYIPVHQGSQTKIQKSQTKINRRQRKL